MGDSEAVKLPQSTVMKLLKSGLGGQKLILTKDAKIAISQIVPAFVSYITDSAVEVAKGRKRKTINESDFIEALKATGFGFFIPQINEFMEALDKRVKEKKLKQKTTDENTLNNSAGDLSLNEISEVGEENISDGIDDSMGN